MFSGGLDRDALRLGYARLGETGGLIPNSALIDMFRLLKGRSDGFHRGHHAHGSTSAIT
jgi:hypothetical protein